MVVVEAVDQGRFRNVVLRPNLARWNVWGMGPLAYNAGQQAPCLLGINFDSAVAAAAPSTRGASVSCLEYRAHKI